MKLFSTVMTAVATCLIASSVHAAPAARPASKTIDPSVQSPAVVHALSASPEAYTPRDTATIQKMVAGVQKKAADLTAPQRVIFEERKSHPIIVRMPDGSGIHTYNTPDTMFFPGADLYCTSYVLDQLTKGAVTSGQQFADADLNCLKLEAAGARSKMIIEPYTVPSS